MWKFVLTAIIVATVIFSGCVSNINTNQQDNNDQNYLAQQNNNQQLNDLQNTINDIQNDPNYQKAKTILENKYSNNRKVTHCFINYGEVTQEFWFSENEARMLTKGPGNFTDKVINETLNCTTDEQGRHACFSMEEDFKSTVEGWKTLGQMSGTCDVIDMNMLMFKILIENQQ